MYPQDDGQSPQLPPKVPSSIAYVRFDIPQVMYALNKCASKLSAGADGIPVFFLRKLKSTLALPLSMLYELCFAIAEIPDQWRSSSVIPIFKKKGNPNQCVNYRPISLIPSCFKVFEKILTSQLYSYFETNKLLSNCQFGYRQKRGTCAQMLNCLAVWNSFLSNNTPADIIYLDFSKAFDCVNHRKLWMCLSQLGIENPLLSMIQDMLRWRTFHVRLDEATSEEHSITAGTPQGGTMSALLWLCYCQQLLNQLSTLPELHVWAYADDIKLTSTNPRVLQAALFYVSQWCSDYQMSLSVGKCVVVPLCGGLNTSYSVSEQFLPRPITSGVRDLGFFVLPTLSFSKHCSIISAKARTMCGTLLKSFTASSPKTLVHVYTVFVRPILESGPQVFNCIKTADSKVIESVQKSFTRSIFRRFKWRMLGYKQRLSKLGLEMLSHRRLIADFSFLYDAYHNLTYCPALINRKMNARQLSHNARLVFDRRAKGISRLMWPQRCVSLWNGIPEKVILASKSVFMKYIRSRFADI